jgi:hypothetical protein
MTIPIFESEPHIVNSSPYFSSNLVPPSRDTQAEFRLSIGFLIVIAVDIGTIKGLKLKECGANGVMQIH